MIDTSQLKTLEATPDAPPPGHVSVGPSDSSLIEDWAATQGTDFIHPYTQEIIEMISMPMRGNPRPSSHR